jgi:hypothetical protein
MSKNTHPSLPYLYAFIIAIAIISLVYVRTNLIPPKWDAVYYVDMAKSGIIGNANLVAPFAYRPAMPLMSGAISTLLSVPIEDGFKIVGGISAFCFLMSIFMLSRSFASDYRQTFLPMILIGFSFAHIKFPLSFYALVDVAAYPLMVVSFWALVTKRLHLCLLVSSIGLLFKEFLAIPLIILIVQLGCDFWRNKSKPHLAQLSLAIVIALSMILIPRLCIPVSTTDQFVDPLNNKSTLMQLINAPLDELRIFNIIYGIFSYWLPTFLFMTRHRFNTLWAELESQKLVVILGIYLLLVLLLTMYGGTNIFVFISYTVAAQALILTLVLRHGVSIVEIVYVIVVTILYNKILTHIPNPNVNYDGYIDFYGAWSSRVTIATIIRFLECCSFVAISALIRIVVSKIS